MLQSQSSKNTIANEKQKQFQCAQAIKHNKQSSNTTPLVSSILLHPHPICPRDSSSNTHLTIPLWQLHLRPLESTPSTRVIAFSINNYVQLSIQRPNKFIQHEQLVELFPLVKNDEDILLFLILGITDDADSVVNASETLLETRSVHPAHGPSADKQGMRIEDVVKRLFGMRRVGNLVVIIAAFCVRGMEQELGDDAMGIWVDVGWKIRRGRGTDSVKCVLRSGVGHIRHRFVQHCVVAITVLFGSFETEFFPLLRERSHCGELGDRVEDGAVCGGDTNLSARKV